MNGENPVVANQVKSPAIGLVVTGILGIVAMLANAAFSLLSSSSAEQYKSAGVPESMSWMFGPAMIVVTTLIAVAGSGFVFYAGKQMMKLQGHGIALAGSIVAMLPCVSGCCCLGLPIGIWALIVLLKPEVKQAFH